NMADVGGSSIADAQENVKILDVEEESREPEAKKARIDTPSKELKYKLEERLNGILCCSVCLDLPKHSVYQCSNGHLMCAGCFAHLLADGRLKDETSTCPKCRCEISKNLCSRNLAVENAVSELPSDCQFCAVQLPRSAIEHHESQMCQERIVTCRFVRIGCQWKGPFHELQNHTDICTRPDSKGSEVMEALEFIDQKRSEESKLFDNIFNLLSYEKITFNDLQLRPYRTDDFITQLYYETSRFTAFNYQWVIKARVDGDKKDPVQTCSRSLSYQLVLKSKVNAPLSVHFVALKGPYGDMDVKPRICQFEFGGEKGMETEYHDLLLATPSDCNKVLAAKTMNMRLILFQIPK
ncbi:unnamed protein product, partial [Owenia fusiformis]